MKRISKEEFDIKKSDVSKGSNGSDGSKSSTSLSTSLHSVTEQHKGIMLSKSELATLVKMHDKPLESQKELAAKIKHYIDIEMAKELEKNGYLSEYLRRWVDVYNNMLDGLHKKMFGDKSVSLHLHKISHADVAAEMRKYSSEK